MIHFNTKINELRSIKQVSALEIFIGDNNLWPKPDATKDALSNVYNSAIAENSRQNFVTFLNFQSINGVHVCSCMFYIYPNGEICLI